MCFLTGSRGFLLSTITVDKFVGNLPIETVTSPSITIFPDTLNLYTFNYSLLNRKLYIHLGYMRVCPLQLCNLRYKCGLL
jgi:hypothetical protein